MVLAWIWPFDCDYFRGLMTQNGRRILTRRKLSASGSDNPHDPIGLRKSTIPTDAAEGAQLRRCFAQWRAPPLVSLVEAGIAETAAKKIGDRLVFCHFEILSALMLDR
jgi:hypothetical protein